MQKLHEVENNSIVFLQKENFEKKVIHSILISGGEKIRLKTPPLPL